MANPYVGEIRMFSGNFAPVGWAFCDGRSLSIPDYNTLYSLIGTTYGGDSQTFKVPNLSSRFPIHQGTGGGDTYTLGQPGGTENVTLTTGQLPLHTHPATCSSVAATGTAPANCVPALATVAAFSKENPPNVPMAGQALTPFGSSLPHDNVQPFLVVNFIIALVGIYPSQ